MKRKVVGIALILSANVLSAAEPDSYRLRQSEDMTFFTKFCNDCHADGEGEGGLKLDELGGDLSDLATFAQWERIFDRVESGEMPPQEADQPSEPERKTFSHALSESLKRAHAARKGTVLRRLNRREYQNTLNDIFGTNLDLENSLPADGRSHEFDNVGDALSISLVQMQQYLRAIDLVLDNSIATSSTKPPPELRRATYAETRESERFIGKDWLKLDDGAVVFFRKLAYPTGMLRTANARSTGRYKIRVTGYAYQSKQPITFSVGATTFARGADKPTFGYFSMPPGKPTTVEMEAWIEERYMIQIEPYGIIDRKNEIRNNGIKTYPGPGLAILHVELEGPLVEQFPSRGHQLVFAGIDRREVEPRNPADKKKSWYKPKFTIVSNQPVRDASTVLQRVASRAFRRPVAENEINAYLTLFKSQLDRSASFEEGLRTAIAAIFCSPDFLFLRESPGFLTDHPLASRLSYFLTRTSPDAPLLAAARTGKLSRDRATFEAQLERLLNHRHFDRFLIDFTDAWLNLRDIEFTSPDRSLYPEFDPYLQYSMVEESRRYLRELIEKNLPVRNIVKSNFAMLNQRLAEHYGMDGVVGPEIRRVALPSGSVRGGFLAQASVLKVSANGTNTSPVQRGVWVMERILGQSPAPPPPGISGVEPDVRGATTLRELLDRHRHQDNCRACHQMIDPPGFALESFNPIGGWRDRFRSLGEGERVDLEVKGRKVRYKLGLVVDASGEIRNRGEFRGYREFRELLAADEDALARAFASKLLTFASGRELGFSDRETIERIVRESRAKGHGTRDLIKLIAISEILRQK